MKKPIRHKPLPSPDSIFDPVYCDKCGEVIEGTNGSIQYEDVDMGDYIERRDVMRLCEKC